MSTTILNTGLEDVGYNLTSRLGTIKATTDKSKVDVSLSTENGPDGDVDVFFHTTLYAFNGVVELADVGGLVEEYFRRRGLSSEMINIYIDDQMIECHLLYCEYVMPGSFDVNEVFFAASHTQRVQRDSVVTIAAVNRGATVPLVIKAVGHNADDGALAVVTREFFYPDGLSNPVQLNVAEIISWATNKTDWTPDVNLSDVLYFSVNYGSVQKLCYITPATAHLSFSFRNIFNIEEFIDIVGDVTAKTEVESGVAVCGGSSQLYDRSVVKSYVVKTEPLSVADLAMVEQLLGSHQVALIADGESFDVIITDRTCEASSDNENLSTVSFTWQFADNHTHRFISMFDGIPASHRNVFSEPFSPEYE